MELEGGLAHDLTGHTPIVCDDSGSGRGHVHHASGSSEDSSTDDIPLKPPSSSNGSGAGHCVTFREQPALLRENGSSNAHRQTSMPIGPLGNGNAVNAAQNDQPASEVAAAYLMKNASISDEHLQDRRKRQVNLNFCSCFVGISTALTLASCSIVLTWQQKILQEGFWQLS